MTHRGGAFPGAFIVCSLTRPHTLLLQLAGASEVALVMQETLNLLGEPPQPPPDREGAGGYGVAGYGLVLCEARWYGDGQWHQALRGPRTSGGGHLVTFTGHEEDPPQVHATPLRWNPDQVRELRAWARFSMLSFGVVEHRGVGIDGKDCRSGKGSRTFSESPTS